MKRFTDTQKWADAWFTELTADQKLLWIYLLDICDPAGVIDYSQRRATFDIGTDAPIDELVGVAGADRLRRLECGKFWLVKFCEFQYPGGVSGSKMHSKVRESILKHRLAVRIDNEYPFDTHSIPIPESLDDSQDKDKDKDKDKVQDKSTGTDPSFDSFWKAYPRKVGKGTALKAWTRAHKEKRLPDLDRILSTLASASASEQWQDSALIPHPTTWLNRDGWDDEYAEFKPTPKNRPPMEFDASGMHW